MTTCTAEGMCPSNMTFQSFLGWSAALSGQNCNKAYFVVMDETILQHSNTFDVDVIARRQTFTHST